MIHQAIAATTRAVSIAARRMIADDAAIHRVRWFLREKKMKRSIQALMLSVALLSGTAYAAVTPSEGSLLLSLSTGYLVGGSLAGIAGTENVVVNSVKQAGHDFEVVLTKVSDGASATVRLSGEAAKGMSAVVGKTVQATAMSTGYILVASGKAIAFIPNEIGMALLHSSKVE